MNRVILDLGSQDINGSYRPLFAFPPWKYVGVDLAGGNNVDVVLSNPYDWREISPESADVIVAGQTFRAYGIFLADRAHAKAQRTLLHNRALELTGAPFPGRLLEDVSRRFARARSRRRTRSAGGDDAMGGPSGVR